MVPLSTRTLQGMQRAYESSLDGTGTLMREAMTDTPTGRSPSYAAEGDPFRIRIDPALTDETSKGQVREEGDTATLSVPVSVPLMHDGDRIVIVRDGFPAETYKIKGEAKPRSGVEFDRKYHAVTA